MHKKTIMVPFITILACILGNAAFAGGCRSWDLNCDPDTGNRTYKANRYYEQQREQKRTGNGTWNLNRDKWGDATYDLNRRNGCSTWDLNCR